MKFKKNQIVYAESQDYGKCIIQLVYRITKNVKGETMKSPIWYAYILDTDGSRDLIEFLLTGEGHQQYVGFFEDYDKNNFIEEICSKD